MGSLCCGSLRTQSTIEGKAPGLHISHTFRTLPLSELFLSGSVRPVHRNSCCLPDSECVPERSCAWFEFSAT